MKETISSIADAIEIFKDLSTKSDEFWYRGQPSEYDILLPGIFREPYIYKDPPQSEINLTIDFMREAPTFLDKAPDSPYINPYASWDWLFLMQHYEVPTRLLDWTESILTALYFCVRDLDDVDIDKRDKNTEEKIAKKYDLWIIDPRKLDDTEDKAIHTPFNKMALYLACSAFVDDTDKLKEALSSGILQETQKPLAVMPMRNFPRMVAQLSVFTIHPKQERGNLIIDALKDEEGGIFRYKVTNRAEIYRDLIKLGIRKHVLFPDLDHISSFIKQRLKNKKYKNHKT